MESPVRSVETTAGSGENGGGGGGKEDSAAESSSSQRFEAKSYLERQVEELSCADEDEAQEKVSQRLQLKQERAKKKRWVRSSRPPPPGDGLGARLGGWVGERWMGRLQCHN